MGEKKGFFSFFKGASSTAYDASIAEEDKQREYALSKAKEEANMASGKSPDIEEEEPVENFITEEIKTFAKDKIEEILNLTKFVCTIEFISQGQNKINFEILNNDGDIGRIIGKDGSTLQALQTIINAIIYKKFNVPVGVILDAGGYRKKRLDTIKNMAQKAAHTVLVTRKKIELSPMNSAERRIVHMMFKNDKEINSYSVGDGEFRHIVIEYKRGKAS
jgi:spoIIIJ-associated protein